MYNVWKALPHFFVTPKGWDNPRLESARFDYFEVIAHCKAMSRHEEEAANGNQCLVPPLSKEGEKVSRVLQIQGKTAVQSSNDEKGRAGMGRAEDQRNRRDAQEGKLRNFDVFRRIQGVS